MTLHQTATLVLILLGAAGCQSRANRGGITSGPDLPFVDGIWTQGTPAPEGVQEIHAAVLNNRIYIAGGIDEGSRTATATYRFDLDTDSWSSIADMPEARHHMPLAVVNDTLYAIGGLTSGPSGALAHDNLWIYVEQTDEWQTRADLPTPRGASAVGVVDSQLVVGGGYDDTGQLLGPLAIYDPASDTWRAGAALPTPRDHLGGAVWNGMVYFVGGRQINIGTELGVVEAYDITTDGWTTHPDMPTARGGLGAVGLNGRIYAFGGEPTIDMLSASEAYLVNAAVWALAPLMPTGRHGLAVTALGGAIYTIGGGPVPGLSQTPAVEVFTPVP